MYRRDVAKVLLERKMIIKEIRISKGKRHNFVIGFNMCQYVFESAEKRSKAFAKFVHLLF